MISALATHPGAHSTTIFSLAGQRVGATMRAPAGLMFSVIALSNGPGLVRLVSQIGRSGAIVFLSFHSADPWACAFHLLVFCGCGFISGPGVTAAFVLIHVAVRLGEEFGERDRGVRIESRNTRAEREGCQSFAGVYFANVFFHAPENDFAGAVGALGGQDGELIAPQAGHDVGF